MVSSKASVELISRTPKPASFPLHRLHLHVVFQAKTALPGVVCGHSKFNTPVMATGS